jgi:hypothetical protein
MTNPKGIPALRFFGMTGLQPAVLSATAEGSPSLSLVGQGQHRVFSA